MTLDLELDFGSYDQRLRQQLARTWKQLNGWGRKQVGSMDDWVEQELKMHRKGKRIGHDYSDWIQRTNRIPDHVARAAAERARFAEGQAKEIEFFFGSTYRRMREDPVMKGVADEWWNGAMRAIHEDGKHSWSVLPMMRDQLQQIQQIEYARIQQEQAQLQAQVESRKRGNEMLRKQP